jgi:hypothetical protein
VQGKVLKWAIRFQTDPTASGFHYEKIRASRDANLKSRLYLVAAGDTVSQVLSARETQVDRPIDTEDFASSVETAESQSRFVVVDDDEALTAIMNAPLAQWRVFLHPIQKKLAIGDRSGPVRVLGGAGTGKTVLAMHRAKWLAEHTTPLDKNVLVNTFTRNLAIDIETNPKTLCSQDVMSRIEVRNLDAQARHPSRTLARHVLWRSPRPRVIS